MSHSFLSKILSVSFTIPGAILFKIFATVLIIFIFEIDSKNLFSFEIPTISKNNFYSLDNVELVKSISKENSFLRNFLKLSFNCLMMVSFWIQHIVLSNKNFKNFMEKYLSYHNFERGFYNLSNTLNIFFNFSYKKLRIFYAFYLFSFGSQSQ